MTIIINHTHVDQRKRAIFWCFGFHFSTIPRVLYPDKEPVYASQPAMARSSRLQARECGSERRSWQHGMHLGVLNEWSYIYIYICHYFIWKVFPQAAIYQMSFLYRYIGLYSNTYIYIYISRRLYIPIKGDYRVTIKSGSLLDKPKDDTTPLVLDSLPPTGDNHETQLLCSPSQMLNTTTSMETLQKVDQEERDREEKAGVC